MVVLLVVKKFKRCNYKVSHHFSHFLLFDVIFFKLSYFTVKKKAYIKLVVLYSWSGFNLLLSGVWLDSHEKDEDTSFLPRKV